MTSRAIRMFLIVLLALPALAAAVPASGAPPWRPASGPDCGPPVPKPPAGYWICTFADDFSGSRLDPARWIPVTTADNGMTGGAGACFVNSPANIAVWNGALHLTARREAAPITCHSPYGSFGTQYTTGQVATYGRFAQAYGRFAVRARFPAATVAGLQSSLWLWPQNNVATRLTGEIDIAEEFSGLADRAVPYLHYSYDLSTVNRLTGVNVVTEDSCLIGDVSAFHTYVVEWTPTTFTIRYDGSTCLVDRYQPAGGNPFAQPYFVALSQALGVGWNQFDPNTTPLPATTTVDWVRIWR